MGNPRELYKVYSRYYFNSEDYSREGKWKFEGKTFAVSEKQAINNVRHRKYGDYGSSQYKPIATSGHWENGLEWSAVREAKCK